jgi:hypothetical protein
MKPTPFPEANRIFRRPPSMPAEECGDLPIFDDGVELVSRWEPTPEERAAIAAGGPVWLWVLGRAHPPVVLTTAAPFEPVPDPEPSRG